MRKVVAIICLTSFFALQYGKLVSYWHCKINAAVTKAICDCEKKLIDVHKESAHHTDATAIAKEKSEESYLFHESDFSTPQLPVIIHTNIPMYVEAIPQQYTDSIFQPPRV